MHFARNEAVENGPTGASTHLTIALTVPFWQTIEAALHVLVMRVWRDGMSSKAFFSVRPALETHVHMMQDPSDGGLLGIPAHLLVHIAIRNAGNNADGELRRSVVFGGKGNVSAAALAMRTLCEQRPTAGQVLDGMVLWDADEGNTSDVGLGSVVSLVRDLHELLPGADASTTLREWFAIKTA